MLTKEEIESAVPSNLRKSVTQKVVDVINNSFSDPIIAENFRNNFITYASVMKEGRFSVDEYINAVKYVSFRIMGYQIKDSYAKAFPDRYQRLVANGATEKDISAYSSAYNKNKLVNLIYEQSMIPVWIVNQDAYQKAINTQLEIMSNPDFSAMARTAAANSVMTHLAKPKDTAALINIDMRENSGIIELKETLAQLAAQQRDLIQAGMSPKDIAAQKLVSEK